MNLQVIKGSLLGDMWIQKNKLRPCSYSIRFEQSEFEYALWKAKQCGTNFSISKSKRVDSRTLKTYYRYYVGLSIDKKIKSYLYNQFYTPKKEVSMNLLNSLSPLAICIWYLDDGNLYYNNNNCHLTLAVNGFNENSRNNIIKYFKDKYNLNFKKTGKAIRITSKKQCILFMDIVEKYIPKCMKRKKLNYQIKKYYNNLPDDRKKFVHKRNRQENWKNICYSRPARKL